MPLPSPGYSKQFKNMWSDLAPHNTTQRLSLLLWRHYVEFQGITAWGCEGCHSLVSLVEGLKQQKCIVSQFWRPDIWYQGVGRAGPLRAMRTICAMPLSQLLVVWHSLACRHILMPLSSHEVLPLCMCLWVQIFPFLWSHLTWLPYKDCPSLNKVTFWGMGVEDFNIGIFRGQNSTHNKLYSRKVVNFLLVLYYFYVQCLINFPLLKGKCELTLLFYHCYHLCSLKCPFCSGICFLKHVLLWFSNILLIRMPHLEFILVVW